MNGGKLLLTDVKVLHFFPPFLCDNCATVIGATLVVGKLGSAFLPPPLVYFAKPPISPSINLGCKLFGCHK